jgi:RNA polymerase sigma factor (sigma-70 family)
LSYFEELTKANDAETLRQEELFPLFARTHRLLKECLRALVQENSIVQFAIIDLGAEIAANIDRNKAIFTRSIDYNNKDDLVDTVADKSKQQAEMLCRCMDLQQAMSRKDKAKQAKIVENTQISRLVFETVITEWLNAVKHYNKLVLSYVRANLDENLDKKIELAAAIYRLEKLYDLDTISGYGTIAFVSKRMEAIRYIYNRISKAYARVVLKMARSQAVSIDYVLDSYQDGNCGLLRAISSYDHMSNARFPGYAKWWIRQRMLFCMKENANVIKVSSNTWQHYAKLESVRIKIESANGPVSTEELAEASGYAESHVESIYNSIKTSQVKSLEYHLSSEGFTLMAVASGCSDEPLIVEDSLAAYEETLALEEQTSPEEQNERNVESLLGRIPSRLKRLICLQYGLIDRIDQNIDPDRITIEKLRQRLAATKSKDHVNEISVKS